MPIRLEPHPAGLILAVRVHPRARRKTVGGIHDGQLKVSVTDPAHKGKANAAVLETLAETLGVAKSRLVILAGQAARSKQILVRADDQTECQRLLALLQTLAHPGDSIDRPPPVTRPHSHQGKKK